MNSVSIQLQRGVGHPARGGIPFRANHIAGERSTLTEFLADVDIPVEAGKVRARSRRSELKHLPIEFRNGRRNKTKRREKEPL